jgi:hypothetical protein
MKDQTDVDGLIRFSSLALKRKEHLKTVRLPFDSTLPSGPLKGHFFLSQPTLLS